MTAGTGSRLGKYELQAELGRGGMGIVYRGFDSALHRPVAIKVLPQQLTYDVEFVHRFQQEAILAARLRHPNIVTIHDVGEQSGIYYIVMEYLEGTTLEHWLARRGPLPVEAAGHILRQLADALDFAHGRGVIHRDVKPANIMVSPDGRATLLDFGLVRAAEGTHLTRSGTILGTPEYMAPEQALGQPMDGRSDIYSLGVVLYRMLAGKPPFSGTSPIGITHAHVYDPPPPMRLARPDLPVAIGAVIERALAKQPADRYDSAGQLADDFAWAIRGEQPSAVGPTRAPTHLMPAPHVRARNTAVLTSGRLPWLAGGLALLALLALAGVILFGRGAGETAAPVITSRPSATLLARAGGGEPSLAYMTQTADSGVKTEAATRPAPSAPPASPAVTPTVAPYPSKVAATPTATPTRPPTEAPSVVRAADGPVNVRSGPGTAYPLVGEARPGETYQIIGRNSEASWWQICCMDGKAAWIAAEVVQASGVSASIPIIAAPPPPTLTPQRPVACAATASSTFARAWDRNRMGCPRGPEQSIWSAYESFERGWMLWRQDNDGHYALFNGGGYAAYWYPPADPPDFACRDAQALGRPRRGFSRVWCENPTVRQRIGNAQNDETGENRPLQEFENGFMVFVKERGAIAVVYSDGTWSEQR